MLNQIAPRAAAVEIGPTTELDREIARVLSDGVPREPREIHAELGPEIALRQVHARLKVMSARGVIERIVAPGAPRRGRGAGTYRQA